jgi:predicted nucleic acid-binding protein
MPLSSVRGLMGDTGFWIEAFDPGGIHHDQAAALLENLRDKPILMPWPIMYEVLRTRTVRNPMMVRAFDRVVRQPKVIKIDDSGFRLASLEATISSAASGRRAISLVDMVIRAVLESNRFHVTTLLTFNAGDFADVCRLQRIALWPRA